MSFKRLHNRSSSLSSVSSLDNSNPPKATRTDAPTHPLLCTLPPTCNPPQNRPTPIANTVELEQHYAKYHAYVCELERCGCVFPEQRLLELHQTECHDPLAALRQERGEKIFGCHNATCSHLFRTPKARRLHLIDVHGYPKEYFFAVTNKGVGGLLKRWGEGASMLRKEWKAREKTATAEDDIGKDEDEEEEEEEEEEEGEEEEEEEEGEDSNMNNDFTTASSNHRGSSSQAEISNETDMSALTDTMQSLSLVPPSIRFGIGGKTSGFAQRNTRGNSKTGRAGGVRSRGRAHGSDSGPINEVGNGRGISYGDGSGNRNGAGVRVSGNVASSSHGFPHHTDYVHRGLPPVRGRGVVPRYGRGRGRGRGRVRGRILIPFAH